MITGEIFPFCKSYFSFFTFLPDFCKIYKNKRLTMDQKIFHNANGRYLNKSDLNTYAYQLSKSYLSISLNNLKSYLSIHPPMIIVLNSLESYASKEPQCNNVLAFCRRILKAINALSINILGEKVIFDILASSAFRKYSTS